MCSITFGLCISTAIPIDIAIGQMLPNVSESKAAGLSKLSKREAKSVKTRPVVLVNFNKAYGNNIVIFKNEESSVFARDDEYMTASTASKLNVLAEKVKKSLPNSTIRVTEAFDKNGEHANYSTHYDGRALDLTLVNQEGALNNKNLSALAILAREAGFDWVFYEDSFHIHVSSQR